MDYWHAWHFSSMEAENSFQASLHVDPERVRQAASGRLVETGDLNTAVGFTPYQSCWHQFRLFIACIDRCMLSNLYLDNFELQ